MKRDWDLIRAILVAAEESEGPLSTADVEGWPADAVNYHIELIVEAGLATGGCTTYLNNGGRTCRIESLTWQGHELLDGIRSKTAWNAIQRLAKEKGLALTFEVVKLAAAEVVKSLFR